MTSNSRLPPVEVRVAQRFRASAERVFNAWVDPGTAGRWLFATALRPMSRVSIDARAGGAFHFEGRRDGKSVVYAGHYIEIVRPRRLAFTVSCGQCADEVARVRVEIVPLAAGCDLRLVQENVPPDDADRIGGRWDGMLYGLAAMLDRRAARRAA